MVYQRLTSKIYIENVITKKPKSKKKQVTSSRSLFVKKRKVNVQESSRRPDGSVNKPEPKLTDQVIEPDGLKWEVVVS